MQFKVNMAQIDLIDVHWFITHIQDLCIIIIISRQTSFRSHIVRPLCDQSGDRHDGEGTRIGDSDSLVRKEGTKRRDTAAPEWLGTAVLTVSLPA